MSKKHKEKVYGKCLLHFKGAIVDGEACAVVANIENIRVGTHDKFDYCNRLVLPETFNGLPVKGFDSISHGFCSIVFPKSIEFIRIRMGRSRLYFRNPAFLSKMENDYCVYGYSYHKGDELIRDHYSLLTKKALLDGLIIDYHKLSYMTAGMWKKTRDNLVHYSYFSLDTARCALAKTANIDFNSCYLFLCIQNLAPICITIDDEYIGSMEVECGTFPKFESNEKKNLNVEKVSADNNLVEIKEKNIDNSLANNSSFSLDNQTTKTTKKAKTHRSKGEIAGAIMRIIKPIITIALVCAILVGVVFGLFSLGKLVVNGISNLFQTLAYRGEKSCYYDNGIIIEESTCDSEGIIVYVCQRHGEEKKEKIPIKHNFMKHCECVDCGYKLENEQYIPKIRNGFYYELGTIKTSDEGEKYISLDFTKYLSSPVKNDIVLPSFLETEDGEMLPVKEVILQYRREYEEHLNGKYVDITIYGHEDMPIDIYVGNFEIENLTVFGNVGILSSYDNDYVEAELKIKNINIYGDLEELVYNPINRTNRNKISKFEQSRRTKNYNKNLKSFIVTGDIKSLDIRFFYGSKVGQINVTKETETINFTDYEGLNYLKKLFNIYVDENNQNYSCYDGVLFTKDQKELLFYPYARKGKLFVIPEGVEIVDYSLGASKKLKMVIVPTSVKTFKWENGASYREKKVYYLGNEEQWTEVQNDSLFYTDKMYYYSEEKIKDNMHWHFNNYNNPKKW